MSISSAHRSLLAHRTRRKNLRLQAGIDPTPPDPRPREAPVDLGGGVDVRAYGLRRDKDGGPTLECRQVLVPLPLLLDHGLGPSSKLRLTLDEARTRPLVKVGENLWLERVPRFVCTNHGELTLGDVTIPVTERLFVTPEALWYLPLDGRPRPIERDEALTRFDEASVAPWPHSPHWYWPPPVPPLAVVAKSDDELDTEHDAALSALIKRPHFALPSAFVCVDTEALLDVPVIRSTIVHGYIVLRTSHGIFHPGRAPTQTMSVGRDLPRIVYGLDPQVWQTVAHLYKANL